MYDSGEARWFFHGAGQAAAERWITDSALAERKDERIDQYLVLPGCSTTGIKVREGNFEVKAQTSPTEPATWSENIAGARDTWVKWSRAAGDLSGLSSQPESGETWIRIGKQRTLRLFSLESGAPVEVPVDGPWLSAGCQVEATNLRVLSADDRHAEPWWSFCFEAVGEPGSLLELLDTMVNHVVNEAPDLELPLAASMSYPAWLSSLVA